MAIYSYSYLSTLPPIAFVLTTTLSWSLLGNRVIDVGSKSETLSNEKANTDPSRVGFSENGLLEVTDLSTMIGPSTRSALINEHGADECQNIQTVRNIQTLTSQIGSYVSDRK